MIHHVQRTLAGIFRATSCQEGLTEVLLDCDGQIVRFPSRDLSEIGIDFDTLRGY